MIHFNTDVRTNAAHSSSSVSWHSISWSLSSVIWTYLKTWKHPTTHFICASSTYSESLQSVKKKLGHRYYKVQMTAEVQIISIYRTCDIYLDGYARHMPCIVYILKILVDNHLSFEKSNHYSVANASVPSYNHSTMCTSATHIGPLLPSSGICLN